MVMTNNKWIKVLDAVEQGLQEYGIDWILEERGGNYNDLKMDLMARLFEVID